MTQIQNMFGSLEIGAWNLFVICLLVLGILSMQNPTLTLIYKSNF
jgi:hypothetical protein